MGLERAAILLQRESSMRLAGDYCATGVGPVQREKLRQLDIDITKDLAAETPVIEIIDAKSDPRVIRRLAPAANRAKECAIRSILILPLVIDSETTGTLLLYKSRSRRFSIQEKHLAGAAASTVSLTIHHFRSQDRARGAADREALTNQLLTAIRSTVTVDEILKVAVDGIGVTLKVTRVVIYKHGVSSLNEDSRFTARAEYRSSAGTERADTDLDLDGSPLLARLLSGQIIDVADTSQSDPIVRALSVRLGMRAMVLAPITYNGHTAATIALEQLDNPRAFTKDEINLLELVTEQTAVALYQAELSGASAARRDALISKISAAIHSSLDSDAVLRAIVDELGVALSVCRCRMALFPSPLPEMVPVNHEYVSDCCADRSSVLQEIQTANNPFLQSVLSQDNPVAVGDPASDPRFAPLRSRLEAGGVKSILTTAIRVDGKPIGILSLHHCDRPHKWTKWEADLVNRYNQSAGPSDRLNCTRGA
jgi:GAF domain-containing protein